MTVSQSTAAMSLRCGGICNKHFVANFVLSRAVKEFLKSFNIYEVIDMSRVSCFLTHTVVTTTNGIYQHCVQVAIMASNIFMLNG